MELPINFNKCKKRIILHQALLSDDNYIPSKIINRTKEIEELTFYLSNFFSDNPSLNNLFIYGLSGTGKSLVTNVVLDKMQEQHNESKRNFKLKIIKIKGTNTKTKYDVIRQIYSELISKTVPRDKHLCYEKILDYLNSKNIALYIFIDEVHEMKEINDIIYFISRINEDLRFRENKSLSKQEFLAVGYIVISNDANLKRKLKDNTRSALYSDDLIFKRYDIEEIKQILLGRIEEGAINSNALDEVCLDKICAYSIQDGGDARYALLLLKTCCIMAEKQGLEKIIERIVNEANTYLRNNLLKEIILDMNAMYKEVLYYVYLEGLENKRMTTGDIYNRYCVNIKNNSLSLGRISQIITEFEKNNVLHTYSIKNKKGRTREIIIDETIDVIKECLEDDGFI